jgi:hypothetical protein
MPARGRYLRRVLIDCWLLETSIDFHYGFLTKMSTELLDATIPIGVNLYRRRSLPSRVELAPFAACSSLLYI